MINFIEALDSMVGCDKCSLFYFIVQKVLVQLNQKITTLVLEKQQLIFLSKMVQKAREDGDFIYE